MVGQTFADLLTQRGVHVLVVEGGRQWLPIVMREIADEAGSTITVDPNHRRGLGGRLLDACHQRWIAGDIARGHLKVRASNEGALALYTRGGWTPSGRRGGYYNDGEDAVTLTWRPPTSDGVNEASGRRRSRSVKLPLPSSRTCALEAHAAMPSAVPSRWFVFLDHIANAPSATGSHPP